MLQEHKDKSCLEPGWKFGFDLAPVRGRVCRYTEKQTTLLVTYCSKASKAEIEDTILHKIAHAIVGPQHQHDAVWKAAAQRSDAPLNALTEFNTRFRAGGNSVDVENSGNDNV